MDSIEEIQAKNVEALESRKFRKSEEKKQITDLFYKISII